MTKLAGQPGALMAGSGLWRILSCCWYFFFFVSNLSTQELSDLPTTHSQGAGVRAQPDRQRVLLNLVPALGRIYPPHPDSNHPLETPPRQEVE